MSLTAPYTVNISMMCSLFTLRVSLPTWTLVGRGTGLRFLRRGDLDLVLDRFLGGGLLRFLELAELAELLEPLEPLDELPELLAELELPEDDDLERLREPALLSLLLEAPLLLRARSLLRLLLALGDIIIV